MGQEDRRAIPSSIFNSRGSVPNSSKRISNFDEEETPQHNKSPSRKKFTKGSPKMKGPTSVRNSFQGVGHSDEPTFSSKMRAQTTKNNGMSPSKMNRCRSGGAVTTKQRDSNGNMYVGVEIVRQQNEKTTYKVDPINGKSIEALQLENEHLNGIITALNLKVKKTYDLE